ncbi:hypothetical protein Hanom_Chr10g00898091 [Helianthus anomalus]
MGGLNIFHLGEAHIVYCKPILLSLSLSLSRGEPSPSTGELPPPPPYIHHPPSPPLTLLHPFNHRLLLKRRCLKLRWGTSGSANFTLIIRKKL